MLEALSGLEPQAFNTLRMQLSNEGEVQEKLDVLRVSSTNSSPMMEAINLSLMNVNETNLGDLAPKLCLLLKSGMGIATKVGTATVISSLVLLCQEHMKPYAGKFLSSLLNGVKNSNASVIKKAYSSCIGAVMKHAQESTVEKVIAKIKGWYFESEDNKNEEACSLCIGAMIKSSSELFTSYGSLLVPLVLVAMQQEESLKGDVKKPWTEIWAELPSGTKASMKLYLSEIYELAKECYQSKLWVIRKNATKAINMVVLSIGGTMQASHVINFLKLTLENLSGRTWDGKETLLDTTMNLCVKCKESIKSQDDLIIMEKVMEQMLIQCNKSNLTYKLHAIKCTTSIIEAWQFHLVDRFIPIFEDLYVQGDSDDEMDISNENGEQQTRTKTNNELTKTCAIINALTSIWPENAQEQEKTWEYVFEKLKGFYKHSSRQVIEVLIDGLAKVVERTDFENLYTKVKGDIKMKLIIDFVILLVPLLLDALNNTSTTQNMKIKSLKCTKVLLTKTQDKRNIFEGLQEFDEAILNAVHKLQNKHSDMDKLIDAIKVIVPKNQQT